MREPRSRASFHIVDVLTLVGGAFAVVLPVFAAMLIILGAVLASLYLLVTHAAFTLVPFVGLALATWLFARWDQWRHQRPSR